MARRLQSWLGVDNSLPAPTAPVNAAGSPEADASSGAPDRASGDPDKQSGVPDEEDDGAGGAAALSRPLKLHLRLFRGPRYSYRVLTLRPSCGVRFSNNYFHDTWHLLSDLGGAAILARLLWGLSYQRQAGTILLVDEAHLVPTPFEADPAAPLLCSVVDSPAAAHLDDEHLAALRRWLRRPGPQVTTVKLQTFGLDAALQRDDRGVSRSYRHDAEHRPLWAKERMSKRAGILCYAAPAEILRAQALVIARMPRHTYFGTNYHYLAEGDAGRPGRSYRAPEGEVQIFSDFRERVAAAKLGRAEAVPELPAERRLSDDQRWSIWPAAERHLARRVADRKRRAARPAR